MIKPLIQSLLAQGADTNSSSTSGLERFIRSLLAYSSSSTLFQRIFPSLADKITIMPMGDSITAGTEPGGYRAPLQDLLQLKGYDFDFVGNQTSNNDPSEDPNHWGKSGFGIAKTNQPLNGQTYVSLQANESTEGSIREGLLSDLDQAISATYFSPFTGDRNIVLLMLGTNDIIHQVVNTQYGATPAGDRNNDARGEQQNQLAESTFERLVFFLETMDQQAMASDLELDVIIGTIPTVTGRWTKDPVSDVMKDEIIEYNNLLKEELPNYFYQQLSLSVVDQFGAIGSSLSDGLHPNAQGYEAMAMAWLGGIEHSLIS